MRLKTKLVLAITGLVLLISGLLSLVYVSQLLHAAVKQSYETNRMVANQVTLALQNALETGLKDQKFDPNNPSELRDLAAEAIRDSEALKVVIDSVNRYSPTVYDINIGDSKSTHASQHQSRTTKTSRCPPVPTTTSLLNANPIQFMRKCSSAHPRSSTWWCPWIATTSRLSPFMWECAPRFCARSMRPGSPKLSR